MGDTVEIAECRPLSKNKCFKVTQVLKAAPRVSDVKEDEAIEKVIHREKTGADAEAKKQKEEEQAKKEAEAANETAEETTDTSDSSDTTES